MRVSEALKLDFVEDPKRKRANSNFKSLKIPWWQESNQLARVRLSIIGDGERKTSGVSDVSDRKRALPFFCLLVRSRFLNHPH